MILDLTTDRFADPDDLIYRHQGIRDYSINFPEAIHRFNYNSLDRELDHRSIFTHSHISRQYRRAGFKTPSSPEEGCCFKDDAASYST